MSITIELYFIRHGQTRSNVERVNGGPTEKLNPTGVSQANQLYESKLLPEEPDVVYASPHARTVETAKLATRREITTSSLLEERSFGKWAGASWDAIRERLKGRIPSSDFL